MHVVGQQLLEIVYIRFENKLIYLIACNFEHLGDIGVGRTQRYLLPASPYLYESADAR